MSDATIPLGEGAESLDEAIDSGFRGRWRRLEEKLVVAADRANPILVKEARQALKSRQFIITFFVVLVACWMVSVGGVAYIGPEIYFAASGPMMLLWYYLVLATPLTLIVPYSAYRSIAAEQEENTYDLLSISTLSAQQIVTGKLLSAAVQMLVYVCAVSPCIAFTFLLRGVDALTAAFLIALAVLGSLGLSMISLLVGAMARVKQTQIVISVALVIALFIVLIGAYELAVEVVRFGVPQERGFWAAMLGLGLLYVTSFGLLRAAAAAQLAFSSENRSTPLRRWMMVQQGCFIGWFVGTIYGLTGRLSTELRPIAMFILAVAAVYWYVMGALMTSEWPHLSRRVQRSLPQTTAGRLLFSFFNPGPGTGYMFAIANLTAVACFALIASIVAVDTSQLFTLDKVLYFTVLSWSYVIGFLGIGRLIINAMRRWTFVPMAAGFLIQVIVLLAGVGVPTLIQLTSRQLRNSGYSLIQMTNPGWTLYELVYSGPDAVQASLLVWIIPPVAIAAFVFNLRSVATELLHHRIAPPIRVAEEESLLHPTPEPGPANPWEAEPPEDAGAAP